MCVRESESEGERKREMTMERERQGEGERERAVPYWIHDHIASAQPGTSVCVFVYLGIHREGAL